MTRSAVEFALICMYYKRTVYPFTPVVRKYFHFFTTQSNCWCPPCLDIPDIFFQDLWNYWGLYCVMAIGWQCSKEERSPLFWIQACFHPIWCSFAPDWDRVNMLHLFNFFQFTNIMLFFTCFPSKLISQHTRVKQKRSLLLLILFVFQLCCFCCESVVRQKDLSHLTLNM